MSGRTVHMCLSVRGAMKWPKRRLKGLFVRDGRNTTAEESWSILADELAKGHEVIPFGECDGFDFVHGCPGHDTP